MTSVYPNIKYPPFARNNEIEGKAIIRFVVTKEGKLGEIEVLRGVSDDIKAECLRIVNNYMLEWKAGTQDGEPVNVYFNLPIRFRLE